MRREDHILVWQLYCDYLENWHKGRSIDSETPEQFAARLRAELEADPDEFLSYFGLLTTDALLVLLGDTAKRLGRDPRRASARSRAEASAHRAEEAERQRATGKSWAAIGRDLAYAEKRPEPYSADAVRGWVRRKRGRL